MIDIKKNYEEEENFFDLKKYNDIKIGEKISGSYSVDFDIWKIHFIIRDLFSYYNIEKKNIEKKISKLNKDISTIKSSFLKVLELKKEKKDLEETLVNFSIDNWNLYVSDMEDNLKRYKMISTYKKTKTFRIGRKPGANPEANTGGKLEGKDTSVDTNLNERLRIIRNYIKYISKFIETDITFHSPFQIGCDECNLALDDMNIDEELNVYICDCNYSFERVYSNESQYEDPDKIDNFTKNSYDDKTNFIRRLRNYQGIHSKKISPEFITFLDNHITEKYKIPSSEVIREMPPDKYGHRGSEYTSISLLIEALKETNNSIYFQEINYICYELWGWICPSIDHLISKMTDDYTRTQEIYKKNYPNFSSINVELRLYWHLRIAGHDCLLSDFKIPQSIESKKRNSHIFEALCKECNLPFFPII